MVESEQEEKLGRFLEWLQANKVDLRGCAIKYSDETKGFGIFSTSAPPPPPPPPSDVLNGGGGRVLLVVPLELAITPMRVLQDPLIGPECRAMFEEGEVDDRFLIILFLLLERLRKHHSTWKPYIDMLPLSFGNPLWFSNEELLELKGTALYRATELQKKQLLSLFNGKVKGLIEKLLAMDGIYENEVCFEDFLWANSVFWSRGMNIPLPRSFVFPQIVDDDNSFSCEDDISIRELNLKANEKAGDGCQVYGESLTSVNEDTVWVEGIIPGIDFCNHDMKAVATWEVDQTGSTAGIPFSMYLLSAEESNFEIEKEITISYGNKGNEELLYLYGFVIDNNPDDCLMVHYPVEALQNIPCSESKMQLLEAQKAELRCLLPKSLLSHGFFPLTTSMPDGESNRKAYQYCNYSWSGQRKIPSYLNKLVFPEELLTTLRTVAMQDDELYKVSSLLEELVGRAGAQQPTAAEVRAAVWEACGDSGALQLLVDLLQTKMMHLEECSATEDCDSKLLEKEQICKNMDHTRRQEENGLSNTSEPIRVNSMSGNTRSSIIYRRGQKQLTRLFSKEAEHALELCLSEGN